MNKQQYLKECFDYNPETGKLYWKERPREHFDYATEWRKWNRRFLGKEAFTRISDRGWYFDWLDTRRKLVYAQNIIWVMLYGKEAKKIFHLDEDRTNNRAANLVEAPLPKADEYVVVYNNTLKNWNVQRNIYSTYSDKVSTKLVLEFSCKEDAVAYKNNKDRENNDRNQEAR
jgi:hypothetical protein